MSMIRPLVPFLSRQGGGVKALSPEIVDARPRCIVGEWDTVMGSCAHFLPWNREMGSTRVGNTYYSLPSGSLCTRSAALYAEQ